MLPQKKTDYLIIGGGIIGLAMARELIQHNPKCRIVILEKENSVTEHGSGRNSGVLHAGFYYTADSLKARFCREGNTALRAYAIQHSLKINPCKKLVVARNEEEQQTLHELKKRGDINGVELRLIDEKEMAVIEPNARTFKEALFSPNTATVDPVQVCNHIAEDLKQRGVEILLGHPYRKRLDNNTVQAGGITISAGNIINCAGLYADKIARDFGFCADYTIIPFKGIYLKYNKANPPLKTNIYPVPNLNNPFLGVHFTVTVNGEVKIGPTAIPAFWRENYKGLDRFCFAEFAEIIGLEVKLLATNAFNFRSLAWEEMQKYHRQHLINLALPMVKNMDGEGFDTWGKPGIRAQLIHKKTLQLVQDFVVEGDKHSLHILNAVSPAFTCSFPFAKWVVDKMCAELSKD